MKKWTNGIRTGFSAMRVIHICQRDDPDIGGSLRVAEALIHEQRNAGIEAWILFLYGESSHISKELSPYGVCLGLDSSRQAGKGVITLRRAIIRIAPDVIHSHDGILWPRVVFLQLRIPVVMHAHLSVRSSMPRMAWGLIKKTTDALIGISEPTIKTWVQAGYPVEKIHYVQNGVDLNRFSMVDQEAKQSFRQKLGLPGDKKILLWLGRLHRSMKGADRIERVGAMLPDNTVLVVVGNGPEYQGLLGRNKDLIHSGKMILVGATPTPHEYYKVADVFLFTSHYEPFGLVILEAVASGIPIIAFPVDQGGGATSLLREFDAYQLTNEATKEDVEAAMNHALSRTPSLLMDAIERTRNKYSWALKSCQIVDVYRRMLGLSGKVQKNLPKVLVCQHGARHRYAIPRMLNRAGMLNAFYTDSSAESLIGKCVKLLGPEAPRPWRSFSRWDIRGVPRGKVFSTDRSFFIELIQKIFCVQKNGIQLYHQRHRVLSVRMKKWGLQGSNIIYSMYHENLDFVRWAKDQGALSVVDVFISPKTDQIMEKERAAFPEWSDTADPDELEFERKLWDETVSMADLLICPSKWVAEGVRATSPVAATKIKVVPYGCSIDFKGRLNKPIKGRILFAGRDPLRKGLHYLAQAATQLKGIIPELDVRVAGVPDSVEKIPLCKDLNFLGQLDGDQMKEEYLSADVLVLPALSEGFAGVVAESIGAGCPVIVTREAGSPVIHEREGLIVASMDVDALVSAILRMVTDRSFRDQCATECLRQIPFYTEEAWKDRLVSAILECAS